MPFLFTRRGWMASLLICFVATTSYAAGETTPASANVRAYGASGDGERLDTEALQRAIDARHDAGGGFVWLPAGSYLTGSLVLRDGVHLYLEAGATILASADIADYASRNLISADGAKDIGIRGPGRIDGQGEAFWATYERSRMTEETRWRWHAGWDWYREENPGHLIRFTNCEHIQIKDITITRSPSWTLHLRGCDGALISGVTIRNPLHGPNTDGIDIVGSSNVRIDSCHVEAGDDAIVLKSMGEGPGKAMVENVTVTNCVLASAANGFKLGTESHLGFRNITFSNSVIYSAADEYEKRTIAGVALEVVDGGVLENVSVSNIVMHNVRAPLFIRLGNRGRWRDEPVPGTVRNVLVSNIVATGSIITSSVTGVPGYPVAGVTLRNLRFVMDGGQPQRVKAADVPELAGAYPEAFMFGHLPAWGLYARHVTDMVVDGLDLLASEADARPAIVLDRVADSVLRNLRAGSASTEQSWLETHNCKALLVQGFTSRAAIPVFLGVHGADSNDIMLQYNDFRNVDTVFHLGEDAKGEAVSEGG